jgi:hypothetical protein
MVLVKQNVLFLPFTKHKASEKHRVSTNGFSDTIIYFLAVMHKKCLNIWTLEYIDIKV